MTDTRRRVKLYALNADRQWDDKGTGHVSSNYVERLKGISLLVRAESDGSLLLESKIQSDTAYQKQQETLIVWSEGENYDLALSFQEKAGCDEIWEKICQVQGKDPSVDFTQDIVEESEDERCFDEISDSVPTIDLPPCEIGKLEEISELVSSCLPSPVRREKLASAIENEGYIKKLLNLFQMCEDLENTEGLHHLYEIFKNIFLLNKNALFELMFAEDTIFDVVGCLEFDPSLSTPKRHRQYLKSIASFHEVIKINNPELLSKIRQTYRVQYIQEVVLPTPSVFEGDVLSTLSSFIFFNKNEIVTQLQEDEKFLTELFNQLTDEDTDENRRKELVLFLKEFFSFSTTLQPQARETFFKTLNSLGVLQAMEVTLASENKKKCQNGEKEPLNRYLNTFQITKSASIDILRYTVDFSPSMVREYMLQQLSSTEDDTLLMNVIIEQMTFDSDPEMGGAVQLMYIIRDLLDPENMLGAVNNKQEKTDFLNYFYKHCMHVLIGPLLANTANDKPEREDSCSVQLLSLILELLTFCVEHHTYHIKNYILHKDLLRRILVLMMSRHTFLVLGALRFMRKIVGLKDEFYNRYIIKGNLFAPVIDALVKNNGRYNMMDSAICEMFEHIRSEDIKSLSTHVVENFGQTVDKVIYVNTFKALRQKYEQQQDRQKERSQAPLENVGSILRQGRFRRDPRQLEEEEEMWFNDDDYDDDVPTSASATNAASPTVAATPSASGSTSASDAAMPSVSSPPSTSGNSSGGASNVSSSSSAHTSSDLSRTDSSTETGSGPLAAVAAVAAVAGSSVGFNSTTAASASAQPQQSSVTSTTNAGNSPGASSDHASTSNKVLSMAELASGKLSESERARAMSPTVKLTSLSNSKKGLVDYDADSDEEEDDSETGSSSPKKQKTGNAEVGAAEQAQEVTETPVTPSSGDIEKSATNPETTPTESGSNAESKPETVKTGEKSGKNTVDEAEAKENQQEVPDSNVVENVQVESNPESSSSNLDSNNEKESSDSVDTTISTTDGASSTSGAEETETNVVDSSKTDEEITNTTVENEQKTNPQAAMETDEVSTSCTEVTTDKDSSKSETETTRNSENSVNLTRKSEENDDDDQPAAKRPRTEDSN